MQNNNEFQYIKSVDDFQSMNTLMDKILNEFKVYEGTPVTADDMSIATNTKALSFISTLNDKDLERLIKYLKQHNSCYLKGLYTGDYACLETPINQNAFVQFSNQFYALLNQKIVNSYLTNVISSDQKPHEIIDYLMHHMIIANDTRSSLIELKEIIERAEQFPKQQELLPAINTRISRLDNIENINTERIPHLTLQEAQEILSHIDYTYTQRNIQQPEIRQTIIPSVQLHIQNIQNIQNHLLFIQNITDAYIQQLENDIQNNSYLKNKETTNEIKLIIQNARNFLLNEELTVEQKLDNFQKYLETKATTLQKNRNQFPYLLLKILLTSIIGYVLYRLLIGSKAPNLVKLINREYQNSLQSKMLYETPNPFRPR